jgi:hypothetical protein
MVLVALSESGDRGPEGGFAEEVVGLEGHGDQRTARAARVHRRAVCRADAIAGVVVASVVVHVEPRIDAALERLTPS